MARAVSREDGFTLVELLVVMVAGMVIVFATFGLIDVTLKETSRTTERVDATQRARGWMERLVQELNSGCVANDFSPIQPSSYTGITPAVSSDANDLVFVSGMGSGASVTSASLFEHVVSFQNGALTDAAYANTGGSAASGGSQSTWTFATKPTSKQVLSNASLPVSPVSPIFSYYSFTNPSNPTANSLSGAMAFPASLMPLSSTWPPQYSSAYSVAQVDIAFSSGPSDGSTDPYTLVNMRDSVVFRLTPPSSGGSIVPCD